MNCPKCGHAQEERVDCLKCGIVFSKYSELHFPEKPQRAEPPVFAPRNVIMHTAEELTPSEVAELRQTVRELNRRFSELEFERADRNQIWKELRGLEQKALSGLQQSLSRLNDCEARIQCIPETSMEMLKEQLWEEDLKPVLEKLEELEAGLEKLAAAQALQAATRVADSAGRLEARVAEVERSVAALAARNDEPAGLAALSEDVNDVKADIGRAAAWAAEIDGLIQSGHVMRTAVEELRKNLEALEARQEAAAPRRLDDQEFGNLRAEVRQSFEQFVTVESKRFVQESGAVREEISSLAERLGVLSAEVKSLGDDISATAGLLKETRQSAADSGLRLAGLGTAVAAIESETDRLRAKLSSLEQQLGVQQNQEQAGQQPLQEDVHSIRDNLDQIRDFMNTLARKL